MIRAIIARFFLWRNGYCTRHLVKKRTATERINDALVEAGMPYFPFTNMFDKATCDLCDLERRTEHKRRVEKSMERLSK